MNYKAIIESILFSFGESVERKKFMEVLQLSEEEVKTIVEEMKEEYQKKCRGIQIMELEDSYQLCTKPEMYDYLIQIKSMPKAYELTDVVLETLSIIAYKQPVTKQEISRIRGVSSDHSVNRLVEYGLIEEVGRLDAPGRPMLFGTTEAFLRNFGVSSVEELPKMKPEQIEEIKETVEQEIGKIDEVEKVEI